jgi:Fic family protein
MEKERLLYLTNEIYRLTLFFPKKEPLKYKLREIADEILAFFLTFQNPSFEKKELLQTLSKFDVLDGFLEIARAQNWVKGEEILKLQKEYLSLKENLKNYLTQPLFQNQSQNQKENSSLVKIPGATAQFRQEKIIQFLKEKGKAQVWEIKQQLFPQISKRTLRRDFEFLVEQGLVERVGESNNTFYRLKSNG